MKVRLPIRLLYVEDDLMVARAVKRNLEDRGCIVTHTPSAAHAVKMLRDTKELQAVQFQGVLTDYEVLDGDGLMVAAEAQALEIPVRIMSGRFAPNAHWDQIWILKGRTTELHEFLESLR